MDDMRIIELFNERDQAAITAVSTKYGRLLHGIAFGILKSKEDSEEVVSDTYIKAWDNIPPDFPRMLKAYLGRIARNISINVLRKNSAQKRGGGDVMLELTDMVGTSDRQEGEIASIINGWLGGLKVSDRVLFVRRYWYMDSLSDIEAACGVSAKNLATRLHRLRARLKAELEREGVIL